MEQDEDIKKLMAQIRQPKDAKPVKPVIQIAPKPKYMPSKPPKIAKTLLEKQPLDFGVIIHRLATIALFFMFIFTFAWCWYLYSNVDARARVFQTTYANNTNHIYAEITSLTSSVGGLRHTVSLLEDRTGKLERKPDLNLSDINAKLNTIQLQTSYLTRSLDANLTSLQVQLAVANRQIGSLLAQNGSCSTDVNCSSNQGNASGFTTPAHLLSYMNLTLDANGKTCRARLVDVFCVSDWCRRNLDPEWLCNAGQAMPEYSGWVEQSCACAREAGLPY